MKKVLHIEYDQIVENCGECFNDVEDPIIGHKHICELTKSEIENHWNGVLSNCPLKDVEDD